MIYTLTISPALDLYVDVKNPQIGIINSATNQDLIIGGKGLNVSLALKGLGLDSIPIAILGGFIGKYIEEELKKEFNPVIVNSDITTRINYKIRNSENETAFNALPKEDTNSLLEVKQYLEQLNRDDILIVSGSASLEAYQYLLNNIKCRLVLDVGGKLLKELIIYKPFIIKPNIEEMYEYNPNIEEGYNELLKNTNIIINTLGNAGARVITKNERYECLGHKGEIITTVGCGDSFLAAFIFSYLNGDSLEACLKFANECAFYRANTGMFYNKK